MKLIDGNLYISKVELIEMFNIPVGTIKAGKSAFDNKVSTAWEYQSFENEILFCYSSLPKQTREKLPTKDTLLFTYHNQQRSDEAERLYAVLLEIKTKRHGKYFNLIKERYNVADERCRDFAQRWAAWEFILKQYVRATNSLENYFKAYTKAFPGSFDCKHSFSNYMRSCKRDGIEKTVIDWRAMSKVQKRISPFQFKFIHELYIQPQKYSCAEIHGKLVVACKEYGEKPYSLASVKNYIKEINQNASAYSSRNGESALNEQLPHASLLPADNIHDQWQLDGWTMPFWCEGDFQRWVLFAVWDNHSRKIVGYSVGRSENTPLILTGIEDAMRETGVLPAEMVFDRHSFQRTSIASNFKTQSMSMGIIWTETINPRQKLVAERYTQYLNSLCKDYAGYLGKGVTAKSKDARISPEHANKLSRRKNQLSKDEIICIAADIVMQYNNAPQKLLGGLSPNQKFEQSVGVNAIIIDEQKRVALINPPTLYKVSSGQIVIKRGIVRHVFQLPAALTAKYNNRELQVVYEDLEQGIYVFEPDSNDCIATLQPVPKIHSAAINQTEKDKQYLNQLSGRKKGVFSQTSKSTLERFDKLANDHRGMEIIAAHTMSKDIAQRVARDRELRLRAGDAGANTLMLPTRKANNSQASDTPTGKSKSAPFADKNHKIGKFDANELLRKTDSENEE